MTITYDKNEKELIFNVELDQTQWLEYQAKSRKAIAKKINIPGFRKGSPAFFDQALKAVSFKDILDHTMDKIFADIINTIFKQEIFIEMKDKTEAISIIDPKTEFIKVDENNFNIKIIFELATKASLGDYLKIKVDAKKNKVDNALIEKEIENIKNRFAMLVPKESDIIEKGDTVVFDFEGFIDNQPFEGGSAKNFSLEIGSNQFVPGFEDQMIGMKKGESKTINIKFPQDYHKEFANKDAQFKLLINDIKVKELKDLSEQDISSVSEQKAKTIDELKTYLKNKLTSENELAYQTDYTNKYLAQLIDICQYSHINEKEINFEVEQITNNIAQNPMFKQLNLTIDKYCQMLGMDKTKFLENLRFEAEQKIKLIAALLAIGDDKKIIIDQANIKQFLVDDEKLDEQRATELIEKIKILPFGNCIKRDIKAQIIKKQLFNSILN